MFCSDLLFNTIILCVIKHVSQVSLFRLQIKNKICIQIVSKGMTRMKSQTLFSNVFYLSSAYYRLR